MTNEVKKVLWSSSNWTAPAGVTSISVNVINQINGITTDFNAFGSSFMRSTVNQTFAWGNNTYGQLGDTTVVSKSSPVLVAGPITTFQRISSTPSETYGMTSAGAIYAWGNNLSAQLGDGTLVPKSSPVAVLGGFTFLDFQTTQLPSVFALSNKSKLYAWGFNANGQLGQGDTVGRSSPVAVLGGYTVTQYSSSGSVSALVTPTGTAYVWGDNTAGQIGDGTLTSKSIPALVIGGITWAKVLPGVAGYSSTYGLAMDGTLYAWGANAYGELGNGTLIQRSSPVAVLGNIKFNEIIPSFQNLGTTVLALDQNGKAYTWGAYPLGIGVSSPVPVSSPVAVLGGLFFKKVVTNNYLTGASYFGLTFSGDLYSWGLNLYGCLGVGDSVTRSSPVLVLGGLKWADVYTTKQANGNNSVFGLANDGQLYAWGRNDQGQLGTGDVAPRSSPVAVLGSMGPNFLPTNPIGQTAQLLRFAVTPGATYKFLIGNGVSFFDTTPIAYGKVERVEIFYNL